MSSGSYKSVCYRCSYEGRGAAGRCPLCQFAMILEPEGTPPRGRRLEEIFARESVSDGAPLLPGVHAEKRQAQILAESRRERMASQKTRRLELPLPGAASGGAGSIEMPRSRFSAVKLTLFCAAAMAVGAAAAAALHMGLP